MSLTPTTPFQSEVMEDSLKYAETVNANLFCSICRMPFIDPYTTTSCHHTFCFLCIKEAISIAPQCPMCRCVASVGTLSPAPIIVRQMVDELLVLCPHAEDGCDATPQRCLKESHLRDECQYVLENCSRPACGAPIRRKDMSEHLEKHCTEMTVECGACRERLRLGDLEAHHRTLCRGASLPCPACSKPLTPSELHSHLVECPAVLVPCSQAAFGCSFVSPRSEMTAHCSSCQYEALKGFFGIFEKKMDGLRLENERLKRRLYDVESKTAQCETNQQELDASVGRALGPWFRTVGPEPYPLVWEDHEAYRTAASVFSRAATPHDRLWTDLDTPPAMHSPGGLTAASPTSPFAVATPQPQPYGPSASAAPYYTSTSAGPSSSPFYTPPAPTVPPVSPSSGGLAAALAALHGGLIRLTGYVEAQSRRNEVRLQTESLTIREEVGEMRSILHGLRLQVHSSLTRMGSGAGYGAAARLSQLGASIGSATEGGSMPSRPSSPSLSPTAAPGALWETSYREPRDPNDTSSMTVLRPERPGNKGQGSSGRKGGVHMLHTVSRVADGKL